MQQFLYFFPLPQGHGSLRPTRGLLLRMGSGFSVPLHVVDGRLLLLADRRWAAALLRAWPRSLSRLSRRNPRPIAPCERSNRSRGRRCWSTWLRRFASPRACIPPWDRPGHSCAAKRWSASGPSPASGLSRRYPEFAAPSRARACAFPVGNVHRQPATPATRTARDSGSANVPAALADRTISVLRRSN